MTLSNTFPLNTMTTNCCDAPFYEPGYPDCDICSACHEHAEPAEDDEQPESARDAVKSTSLFGFCRDCRHWQATTQTRESLAEYPRDKHPDDGWLDAVCKCIQHGTQITASGGWNGASVDSVETDANFGCRYFEPNNPNPPTP
jgi:hypothetical protein